VLLAGLAAGLGLPHECASGTCGSCRAQVVAGAAEDLWPGAPGRRHLRSAGEVLMCQTTACGDLGLVLRGALPEAAAPAAARRKGRLSRITALSPDIATFRIALDAPLPYLAGQFALVEIDGVSGPRAWSMTRRHAGGCMLDFLLRRAPGGAASALLFDEGFTEIAAQVFGPLGRASYAPEEGRPFVAIAGGSGIAGMLAILDHPLRHPAHLFFGLRDPTSAYLLDHLASLVQTQEGRLEVTVAFSDAPADALATIYPDLRFAHGMVHAVAQEALAAAPRDPAMLHFVAGPPPMVDAAMRALVLGLKIPPTEIRYDRFG
jgi:toluene monooxygenase electron transfer component